MVLFLHIWLELSKHSSGKNIWETVWIFLHNFTPRDRASRKILRYIGRAHGEEFDPDIPSAVFSHEKKKLFILNALSLRENVFNEKSINFSMHPENKLNIVQNAVEVYYPTKTLHLK